VQLTANLHLNIAQDKFSSPGELTDMRGITVNPDETMSWMSEREAIVDA